MKKLLLTSFLSFALLFSLNLFTSYAEEVHTVTALDTNNLESVDTSSETLEALSLSTIKKQEKIDAVTGPKFGISNNPESIANAVNASKAIDKPTYVKGNSLGSFKTTAFTAEEHGNHTTASGVAPTLNHTISADWSVLPKGTKVFIGDSDIIYTVEDKGSGVKGNSIDIFLATNKEAIKYGVQYKEVFLAVLSE